MPDSQSSVAFQPDLAAQPAVGVASRAVLYDAVRDIYYAKPALRGWLHLIAFEVSLVVGTLLVQRAHGGRQVVAAVVFAGSIAGLFGASALYHRGNWGPAATRVLQRLDHTMIFVVIAATATPAFLLAAPGTPGVVGLAVLWTLTAAAALTHVRKMHTQLFVGAFLTLSVVASTAIPELWIHVGAAPALLMIASGLLDAAGAISFRLRRPDPRPTVFGYHEVFHAYVCAAALCQYIAIGGFVI